VRVSAVICFDYNNDIYLYNSAYDPAYFSLSVSLLLEVFCIRDAIAKRKIRFDFLSEMNVISTIRWQGCANLSMFNIQELVCAYC